MLHAGVLSLNERIWKNMTIQQIFIEPNKFSRPQIPLKKVTKIAVHYVGNPGSTAIANRSYFNNLAKTGGRYVSAHFVVGLEGEVIQCIPLDEISYCTNQANSYSVSIETCHPDSTGKFNPQTEKSLVELTAYLLKKFGLTAEDVIRHYDVTGKRCPLYYVTNPAAWESFREMVKKLLESGSDCEDTDTRQDTGFRVQVIDPALNIRKYPSLTAPVVGVIEGGGVFTITKTEYGGNILWGRLKSGAGWISLGGKYVKKL